MRIAKKTQSLLVLKNNRSLVFGLLSYLFIAFLIVYTFFASLTHANSPSWTPLLFGLLTCIVLYIILSILSEGFITLEMDKNTDKVIFSRTGLLIREYVEYDLSEISSVYLDNWFDSEGVVYWGVLTIKNRDFKLHPDFFVSYKSPTRIVDEISDFLNLSKDLSKG